MLGLSYSDACVWGKGKATSGAKGTEEYIPDAASTLLTKFVDF
jgi:hypothetical protein